MSLALLLVIGATLAHGQLFFPPVPLGTTKRVATRTVQRSDDAISGGILIHFNFPIGSPSASHRVAYVSTNGLVSIGKPFAYCCPSNFPVGSAPPIVAPFWCDGDTRRSGEVRYEVHQQQVGGSTELLQNITNYLITNQSLPSDFTVYWALVAEWRNLPPFPHGYDLQRSGPDPTNSFQCIIATDCYQAYAIFIYECDAIGWSGQVFPAQVGYSTPASGSQSHPDSGYNRIASVINSTACASPSHVHNVVHELGSRSRSVVNRCEVLKVNHRDYVIEHNLND